MLGVDSFDDAALKRSFDAIDADGSGELDAGEMRAMFLKVSPALEQSPAFATMLERVLAKLDVDGNKTVSWDEFKSAFIVYQLSLMDRAALYGRA